jgi:cytochrome P450
MLVTSSGTVPPGPRTPALWQTFQAITRPRPYALEMRRRYGDIVSFHTLLGRGVAVAEASLARAVFSAPPDTFETSDMIGSIFGARAVIATSGSVHKRQRKLLNPQFHGPRIRALLETMQRVVRHHLEPLARAANTRTTVLMTDITQAMTLDVILHTVFGSSADLDRGRRLLLDLMHGFSPAIILSKKLHTRLFPPWRRYARAREEFNTWVDSLLAERRLRGDHGSDLLGLFLDTRYADGESMTNDEIQNHLITLLIAGHETSAVAIAWTVYWLLREPAVLARLRKELSSLGAGPSADALVRLPYLAAVASESLRIEPVVTDVIRVCRAPFQLGRYTVPRGAIVAVAVGAILWDGCIFPEPNRFRPERFLDRTYNAGEFLPFGGGQRRCLGASFAEAEMAIAIATIATEWELELARKRPEFAVRRNITMGPRHGVAVSVVGRRAAHRRDLSTSADLT